MDNFIYYSLLWLLGGCCHLYVEWSSCCLILHFMVNIEGVLFVPLRWMIVIFTVFEFVLCLFLLWVMYDFYRVFHSNFYVTDRKHLQCLYFCIIVSFEIIVISTVNSCSYWWYYLQWLRTCTLLIFCVFIERICPPSHTIVLSLLWLWIGVIISIEKVNFS